MGHASSFLLRDTVPTLRSAEGDNPLRSASIARTEHERRPLDPPMLFAVPDLVFGLQFADGSRHSFLVEIDRGTMPIARSPSS